MIDGKRRKGKRGHGEGTIGQRADGRWYAMVMVGYRLDGKPDRRTVYGKTRAECQRKLDELRQRAEVGLLGDAAAGRETVGRFLVQWLDAIGGTMEPGSLRRHRDNVTRHLTPAIGRHKLADLRPEHLVSLFAQLRRQGLSPRTVKYCFTTIRRALDAAVKYGTIARNVARTIDAPKVPRVEIVAPSPDEVARLLASAEAHQDRLTPVYTVAVYSGCRLGELLALQWQDVSLEAGTLTVRRTLVQARGGVPEYGDPKTSRSRRSLRLSPDAVTALRVQQDRQAFERQALVEGYGGHNLVFATPTGTPLDAANVLKRLRAALALAGLPAYTFHSLRHAAATMMLAAGVNPKVAADRLGHYSAAFTLDRYTHAVESLDLDAAERLQAVMRRARSG